jgi:UDP-glucose 6-dehydrogenase
MKKVSVMGLGFIGLATAVYLASKGYYVTASSNQKEKLRRIENGEVPFFECFPKI